MKLFPALLVLGVTCAAIAGCEKSNAAERGATPVLERNDQLAITTRDGNVVLALTNAKTVVMRLSDSLRRHVDGEIAKEFANDSADTRFGRWVQRTTASLVAKGMALELSVPLKDIEDVRYEDGELRFEYSNDRKLKFHSFKRDGRSAMGDFDREDAERFADAIRKELKR
ncbi:MAG TPA: hypothetical protein VJ717_04030 [Gemmatimonadaceae bacterium]|nr:hypothetical protein [Gemmatimonadaceae bacterium]